MLKASTMTCRIMRAFCDNFHTILNMLSIVVSNALFTAFPISLTDFPSRLSYCMRLPEIPPDNQMCFSHILMPALTDMYFFRRPDASDSILSGREFDYLLLLSAIFITFLSMVMDYCRNCPAWFRQRSVSGFSGYLRVSVLSCM